MVDGGREEARERFGGKGGKVAACATGGRARGGQGCASHPSVRCPFGSKLATNLGREWVKSGEKMDDGPFAAARSEACFVRLPPNGCGRTIWGRAMELA